MQRIPTMQRLLLPLPRYMKFLIHDPLVSLDLALLEILAYNDLSHLPYLFAYFAFLITPNLYVSPCSEFNDDCFASNRMPDLASSILLLTDPTKRLISFVSGGYMWCTTLSLPIVPEHE
jgi:hypothetical protein